MSSLKDLASLIMIPSLYEDGKLHTVKPLADENIIVHPDATDNNDGVDGSTPSTSSNFTFSRGSNLAATRVDVNGLIEKGRENVLLYSQDFSNAAWSKSNLSLTSNQTDPFGGTNAFLFTSTSTANNLFVQSLSNANRVCSIYAKAGNRSNFALVNNTYGNGATFDLSAETAISVGQGSLAVIESVGNDWYRCSVYFSLGTQFLVVLSDVNGNGYSNGDTMSFFGAQMESSLVATDYIETGASTAQAGILEDMPRLDYSGGASCPALLLEPQRTNLFTDSEYFNGWSRAGTTPIFTNNYGTSPEGLQNSTRVQLDNSDIFYKAVNLSQGAYVFSVFGKAISGGSSQIILRVDIPSAKRAVFDLSDGTIVTNTADDADIIDYGNGWYRCILIQDNDTIANAVIEEYNDSLDCEIWGAQLEAGSYPTSYIPTYGASVTRSKEGAQVTSVSDLIGQTQGTLFAEVDSFGVGEVANRILGVSNGTSAERVIMLTRSNGFRFIVTNSSVNGVDYTKYTTTEGVHKLAMTYDANEVRIFVDGVKVTTDSSVTLPSSLNSAHIGKAEINHNYGNNFGGSVKQSAVFPTALTDSECIALTTL